VEEKTMTLKNVVLKDGSGVCVLRPLEDREGFDRARIVGGTFGRKGDVLRKPSDISWEEATEEIAPGRTTLSPFDLELVRDVVTKLTYLPEGGLEALCRLSEDVTVERENATEDTEYRAAVARLLVRLEELPARAAGPDLERRKIHAA
jgi:hypothetical protein